MGHLSRDIHLEQETTKVVFANPHWMTQPQVGCQLPTQEQPVPLSHLIEHSESESPILSKKTKHLLPVALKEITRTTRDWKSSTAPKQEAANQVWHVICAVTPQK
jgi:hypothetical protein